MYTKEKRAEPRKEQDAMKLMDKMIEYRAKNKISMREAAKKAGISLQTWMYLERDLQKPTRLTEAKLNRLFEEE